MTSRRPAVRTLALAAALLVLLAGLLTACGGGSDEEVESPTRDTSAASTTPASVPPSSTTAPRTSSTVPPTAPGVDLDVFFLRGDKLGTAHRRVAPTQSVARTALEQLFAGPNATEQGAGMRTVMAAATKVDGLDIADGLATVQLSPYFGRGYNDVTAQQARAQIVFTLTQFTTVQRVRFGIGAPIVDRGSYTDVLPFVLVESVAPGDVITSPVTIAGLNNTFENTVRMRVLGANRRVLADTFTTGTGGMGTWGPFSVKIGFAKGADATGFVVVFEDSPKDGSMINVVEIPVRFA